MRQMICVIKEPTEDSKGFKIYFYKNSDIIVCRSGSVDMIYNPDADIKVKILFERKEYTLDSKELIVYLNDSDWNNTTKQDVDMSSNTV